MVEKKKRFYLYDRWFEFQTETEEKMVYISIPRAYLNMKIEIDKVENKITVFSYEGKKLLNRIEICNLESPNVQLHYAEEKCQEIEFGGTKYNNLLMELFIEIENDTIKNSQIMFVPKRKKDNLDEFLIPLNEKIEMSDLDVTSKRVERFTDFARNLLINKQVVLEGIKSTSKVETRENRPLVRKLTIPHKLEVYDRIYKLVKTEKNQIILMNQEEEVRNLEIKFDPITLSLISICLRINNYDSQKSVLQIIPNDLNGVTVRCFTRKKSEMRIGDKKIETPKIKATITFDANQQKVSNDITIATCEKEVKLLEHPYLRGNYTDGAGNLVTLGNSSYSILLGIASFAPQIFRSIDKKIFVKKLESGNKE